MKSLQVSRGTNRILVYAMLGTGAILMIFLFLWALLTSFKSAGESTQIPPTTLPECWLTDNHGRVLETLPFVKLYLSTTPLILFRVSCAVTFSSAAGFALARLNFKDKGLLFSLVIVQMMLSSQVFIIPQYQILAKLGLTNSLFALVFPGIVNVFGIFSLHQVRMGISDRLEEVAYLDGCTKQQTLTKVVMPLTKASMAVLTTFTAVFVHTDLMWPLITNTGLNKMALSAGLPTLREQSITNYPILMAGSMLAMTPMMILCMVPQKQFVEGVAMTGGE